MWRLKCPKKSGRATVTSKSLAKSILCGGGEEADGAALEVLIANEHLIDAISRNIASTQDENAWTPYRAYLDQIHQANQQYQAAFNRFIAGFRSVVRDTPSISPGAPVIPPLVRTEDLAQTTKEVSSSLQNVQRFVCKDSFSYRDVMDLIHAHNKSQENLYIAMFSWENAAANAPPNNFDMDDIFMNPGANNVMAIGDELIRNISELVPISGQSGLYRYGLIRSVVSLSEKFRTELAGKLRRPAVPSVVESPYENNGRLALKRYAVLIHNVKGLLSKDRLTYKDLAQIDRAISLAAAFENSSAYKVPSASDAYTASSRPLTFFPVDLGGKRISDGEHAGQLIESYGTLDFPVEPIAPFHGPTGAWSAGDPELNSASRFGIGTSLFSLGSFGLVQLVTTLCTIVTAEHLFRRLWSAHWTEGLGRRPQRM